MRGFLKNLKSILIIIEERKESFGVNKMIRFSFIFAIRIKYRLGRDVLHPPNHRVE
jgi:hypothetical protein